MRRVVLWYIGTALALSVATLSAGAAPAPPPPDPRPAVQPAPSPSPVPRDPQACVVWTVPDMQPSPEVRSRLDALKARTGKTIAPTRIGKTTCFASGAARDQWFGQGGMQEYEAWLRAQPEYQAYEAARGSAGDDPSSPTILADSRVDLYYDAGYGGGNPVTFLGPAGGAQGGDPAAPA